MSGRPSDGMDLDELRDEFDWMFEFQSLMAERIRGDADVHNLVDYVGKLEDENAKLREELEAAKHDLSLFSSVLVASKFENAKLRELVKDMWGWLTARTVGGATLHDLSGRMRELGVEVS